MSVHRIILHLFHIFFVGLLFLYVGIYKDKLNSKMYTFLLILGLFIVVFHSYKAWVRILNKQNPWVNLFHIFVVAPLLLYIGFYNGKVQRLYYELLLMLGFATIGYHFYYLMIGD